MGKKFKNVKEMINELSEGQQFKEMANKEIESHKISKFLIVLRCNNNMTQKQLAEKIGCTQSRISKIESSHDTELSVADLSDYAKALNLKLEIGYRNASIKIVDLVKYHAIKVSECLNQLVEMTKYNEDESIDKGIEDFLAEAIVNMNNISVQPYLKHQALKNKKIKEKGDIHISAPMDLATEHKDKNSLSTEENTTEMKS